MFRVTCTETFNDGKMYYEGERYNLTDPVVAKMIESGQAKRLMLADGRTIKEWNEKKKQAVPAGLAPGDVGENSPIIPSLGPPPPPPPVVDGAELLAKAEKLEALKNEKAEFDAGYEKAKIERLSEQNPAKKGALTIAMNAASDKLKELSIEIKNIERSIEILTKPAV